MSFLTSILRGRPRRVEPGLAYEIWAACYPPLPHNELMRLEQERMEAVLGSITIDRVLDLGTGSGRYLRLLQGTGAGLLVGLDRSKAMLERAIEIGVPLVRADARALPLKEERFDLVVASLVVGDVSDLSSWAREASRVLAARGSLVYSDFHPSWSERRWERTFRGPDGRWFRVPFHPHDREQHRAALEGAGLEVVGIHEVGDSACLVVHARKR